MKTRQFSGFSVIQTNRSDGNVNSVRAYKNLLHQKSLPFPPKLIEANQIHQNHIYIVEPTTPDESKIPQIDGLLTADQKVALLIKTADCIPLVIYDPINHVISAIHAGWRGLMQDFPVTTINVMASRFNSQYDALQIYIGPSIRKCCYAFQQEPAQTQLVSWQAYISHQESGWHIDLVGYLKSKLAMSGIALQNITDSNECTCHNQQWHSYFRHKQMPEEPYGTNATIVQLT